MKTEFKGVSYKNSISRSSKPQRKWLAQLGTKSLGFYSTDKEAAIARDKEIIRTGSTKPLQVLKKI